MAIKELVGIEDLDVTKFGYIRNVLDRQLIGRWCTSPSRCYDNVGLTTWTTASIDLRRTLVASAVTAIG